MFCKDGSYALIDCGAPDASQFKKNHFGEGKLICPAVPPYAIPEPPGKGEKPQTEKVIFDFLSGLEMTGTILPDDVVKWWKEQAAIKKGEVTL